MIEMRGEAIYIKCDNCGTDQAADFEHIGDFEEDDLIQTAYDCKLCGWSNVASFTKKEWFAADAWHAPDIGMRRDADGELYEVELPPDDQPATIDDLLQFSEPHLATIAAALSAALAQAEIDLKIASAVAAGSRADLLPIASQQSYEDEARRIRERRDELAAALEWVNELRAALIGPG